MDGQSLNITQDLITKLKEIIPSAFTEDKLNIDQLKQLLGEDINTDNERYQLNWAGKNEAYKALQFPTTSTLQPNKEESIKNIIIYDDFTTWIDSGDALFDWEKIVKSSPKKAVTTNKIKNDFAGNEVAANRDYANQWVRLKGTVKNVKLDKDGKMYADLTENYVNFKAYISDSEFAASLQPNQKIDMYCFNATASSATQCINYQSSIWEKASEANLSEIRANKGISSFSSISSYISTASPFETL